MGAQGMTYVEGREGRIKWNIICIANYGGEDFHCIFLTDSLPCCQMERIAKGLKGSFSSEVSLDVAVSCRQILTRPASFCTLCLQ